MKKSPESYFLCGVGGSGMSALADALLAGGSRVAGSDRLFDAGGGERIRRCLEAAGVRIFSQDGSGVTGAVDRLVVSSAVEPSIPDVKAAVEAGVCIQKRAEVLAELVNARRGIAVGGTSGKSTVTAMLAHILRETGKSPTVVNGAVMLNSTAADGLGNSWRGSSDLWVVEADESDGSIKLYMPYVSVVTTVSEDHLPLVELQRLFADFVAEGTHGAVVNADCREARRLVAYNPSTVSFGIAAESADFRAEKVCPRVDGMDFTVRGVAVRLAVPGRHNVLNALAAVAAAGMLGVPVADSAEALATFAGVHRRLQLVGSSPAGCTVIDDFAHNPEKIAATLATLKQFAGRLILFYQPHGFRPTMMLRAGLVDAFCAGMGDEDVLLMPDIFYAGGTASRDISSADLIADIGRRGRQARHCPERADALAWLAGNARPGDRIVVMGARDDTLADFARQILETVP